jgi:hypothetical protein
LARLFSWIGRLQANGPKDAPFPSSNMATPTWLERNQTLSFSSRPFVLCGLPVRKLPDGQLVDARRNGQFVLQVTRYPAFGVPFGQDRIVPIFLATLAVRQKSQTTAPVFRATVKQYRCARR